MGWLENGGIGRIATARSASGSLLVSRGLVCRLHTRFAADWPCVFDFGDECAESVCVDGAEVDVVDSRDLQDIDNLFQQLNHVGFWLYIESRDLTNTKLVALFV